MKRKVRKLAVLASGEGTTLQAIIASIRETRVLNAEIAVVVSDTRNAFALIRAELACIKIHVLTGETEEKRDEELNSVLRKAGVELVVSAGYSKLIGPKVLKDFVVINTHPSLLPKYGGKGMYDMRVHQAVVDNKESESGATVHFVNEEYDKGPIIWQTHVPVYPEDDAASVRERVQAAEKTQLVSILKDFSEGKIDIPN